MKYIYDQFGRKINLDDVRAVEHLEKLKKRSGNNPWPVIEECFKIWEAKKPREYKSHLTYINDVRETRKDRKFASTKDKTTGGILRYTVDIPLTVMYMIRLLYSNAELPMNREFFLEFARKFPNYKIAEKI